ncbi:putative serine/threonine-protein kinase [Cedratvirus lausannensis]|uniref:Putative serine/threonine-protein kinase n=1 Tax=Cedratvirus lausannensis TaxID=2023205 RepID=A0A285PXR3_9VIRU|nr:putative serine/threonine-protein kinase [Cedratvirus lausannensis]
MECVNGYKCLELLGSGSFGQVYKVEKDGEQWAVKKFNPSSLLCRDVVTHCAEIDICLHLSSPHLIKGKEYFHHNSQYYLVMELAECSLDQYTGPLKADLLIPQLLLCLQALQENNLSHGDIKSTNFLVKQDKVLLTDFGLSRSQDVTTRNTFQSWTLDSPQNMVANHCIKREDINKHHDIFMEDPDGFDSVGDVWALGVTVVHVITGKLLFYSPDYSNVQGYLRLMEEYISSPEAYLAKMGVDKTWFPLLLRMLCPSYKNRVKRVSDLTGVKLAVDDSFYSRVEPVTGPVFTCMLAWGEKIYVYFSLAHDTIRESKLLYQHCYQKKNMQHVTDTKEHMMLFCSCLTIINSMHQNNLIHAMDVAHASSDAFDEVEFTMYQNKLFDELQGRVFVKA